MSDDVRNDPGTPPPSAIAAATADPPHIDALAPPVSEHALEAAPEPMAGGDDWGELSGCFLEIWTRPRETIRRIVEVNPKYWVVTLAALGGSTSSISLRSGGPADRSLMGILLVGATIGPLAAVAFLWFNAWMVRGLGHRLLGGVADPQEMRAALAWANVPMVAMLPVAILAAVLGAPGYRPASGMPLTAYPLIAVSVVAGIWNMFIASQNVAEVQGYSSGWKGFWNVIIPSVLIGSVVGVIGVLVAVTRLIS